MMQLLYICASAVSEAKSHSTKINTSQHITVRSLQRKGLRLVQLRVFSLETHVEQLS